MTPVVVGLTGVVDVDGGRGVVVVGGRGLAGSVGGCAGTSGVGGSSGCVGVVGGCGIGVPPSRHDESSGKTKSEINRSHSESTEKSYTHRCLQRGTRRYFRRHPSSQQPRQWRRILFKRAIVLLRKNIPPRDMRDSPPSVTLMLTFQSTRLSVTFIKTAIGESSPA